MKDFKENWKLYAVLIVGFSILKAAFGWLGGMLILVAGTIVYFLGMSKGASSNEEAPEQQPEQNANAPAPSVAQSPESVPESSDAPDPSTS